jgi:Esterase PHB depolymerase
MLDQDIVREATRLARSGRLTEATALLQRMLRGENAPNPVPTAGSRVPVTGTEPPTIDAKANEAETRVRPRPRTRRTPSNLPKNFPGFGPGVSLRRAPPSMADMVPDGTSFVEGTYKNAAGSRAYRLFTPSGYHGQAIPLVIMLHGCTQSPEDFAAGTRMNFIAEKQTCFVAYPAQRADANQAKCWNWFRPSDQQRGGGEPRSSLVSPARSCATIRSIRDASMSPDCRPGPRLLPSWDPPTATSTQRLAYIPEWPAAPPPIFRPRSSP